MRSKHHLSKVQTVRKCCMIFWSRTVFKRAKGCRIMQHARVELNHCVGFFLFRFHKIRLYTVIQAVSSIKQGLSYWGTDDESIWSLSLKERQPLLLLQGKHDDGQSEDQSLSRTGEGDSNHVPTWQTTRQTHVNSWTVFTYLNMTYFTVCCVSRMSVHCTYTVGIPWIWMGVGCTMPFFFKPFRIAAKNKSFVASC